MKKILLFIGILVGFISCKKETEVIPNNPQEVEKRRVQFNFTGRPTNGFALLFKSTIYYMNGSDTVFIDKNKSNFPVNDSCKIYFEMEPNTVIFYYFDFFTGRTTINATINDSIVLPDTIKYGYNCQYLDGQLIIN